MHAEASPVSESVSMEDNPLVDWILRLIKMHAIKGLKRVAQENGERIVNGTVIAGFEVSKAVLARETQQMVASGVATTVVSGLFLEFRFGVGPREREFGPGSVMAVRMQDAYGVKNAKSYFYETRAVTYKKSPGLLIQKPLTEYSAGFNPVMGPIRAWDDAVEQFDEDRLHERDVRSLFLVSHPIHQELRAGRWVAPDGHGKYQADHLLG